MRVTKTLAVIGANDETVAHLRLLMKLGATQLTHEWNWGAEENADFVAVDVHDLGAQGVVSRCQAAGVPCAIMADTNEVVVHGLVLRRPFKLDQIVAVLNAAGTASAEAGQVEAFSDDFYTRDLDEAAIPTGSRNPEDLWAKHERPQASAPLTRGDEPTTARGLDFLIHGDPLVEPEPPKPLIRPGTSIAPGSVERTRRSEGRADEARHRVMPPGVVGVSTVDVAPIVLPTAGEGVESGYRLAEFLDGELVLSPSQLQLPDAPTLTLDPKKRAYHADADLSALAEYARQNLPRSLLKGASTTELARVRETQPARTYEELRWLIALVKAGGRLASKLDPGGTFQVEHPVHVDSKFHAHGAIATALAKPLRLHEIAAASGASMEHVFDVVTAYEAIGRLRWTPRQRLAPDPTPEPKPGGLGRFWPFGKR